MRLLAGCTHYALPLTIISLLVYVMVSAFVLKNYQRNDGMNYIDVSRSISNGHGIVQFTLGFNEITFEPDDTIPKPLTVQPPLYPMAVAGVSLFGVPHIEAAIIVSASATLAAVIGVYYLYRQLYDVRLGLVAALILSAQYAFLELGIYPRTDTLGIALTIWWLWALKQSVVYRWALPWTFVAGLFAGIGFGTRYILGLWLPVGIAFMIFNLRQISWRVMLSYCVGWGLVGVPVVARNWMLTGQLTGAIRNPSDVGLVQNTNNALHAICGKYLPASLLTIESIVLFGIAGVVVALTSYHMTKHQQRERIHRVLNDLVFSEQRWWPLAVATVFTIAIIIVRTNSHFDTLNYRLLILASVITTITATVVFFYFIRQLPHLENAFVALLLLVGLLQPLSLYAVIVPQDPAASIQTQPLLHWIDTETPAHALIVAEDGVIVTVHFPQRHTISYSEFPYTNYMSYERLYAWVCNHQTKYTGIYLATEPLRDGRQNYRQNYGPFILDLQEENYEMYPGFALHVVLEDDRRIYTVECVG